MNPKLNLNNDTFISGDTSTFSLHLESEKTIIKFSKEQAKEIAKFINHVYGKNQKWEMPKRLINEIFEALDTIFAKAMHLFAVLLYLVMVVLILLWMWIWVCLCHELVFK